MFYGALLVFCAVVVALDQISKALTLANIPLYGVVEAVPGLFHLTHVHNTGAAFSSFQGMQWLFALVFLVFTALLVWEAVKQSLQLSKFDWFCVAAIYGGGLGNMIDRVRFGFVVDMIEVDFIRFPVFNVGDSFITCGILLLLIDLLFFNRAFWKEDGK